jgi:preprotein translocase subunit SecG
MTNDFFANKVVVNLRKRIDILFIAFCIILVIIYSIYISNMQQPIHDGAVYLLNAKSWLEGTKLYEGFRPQLLSWIISGIWILTGENWLLVKYIQSAFTIASGIILYLVIKHHKGPEFAFGVSGLTMLNGTVFANSIQILTEGLALFFLVLSLFFQKESLVFGRNFYRFNICVTIYNCNTGIGDLYNGGNLGKKANPHCKNITSDSTSHGHRNFGNLFKNKPVSNFFTWRLIFDFQPFYILFCKFC